MAQPIGELYWGKQTRARLWGQLDHLFQRAGVGRYQPAADCHRGGQQAPAAAGWLRPACGGRGCHRRACWGARPLRGHGRRADDGGLPGPRQRARRRRRRWGRIWLPFCACACTGCDKCAGRYRVCGAGRQRDAHHSQLHPRGPRRCLVPHDSQCRLAALLAHEVHGRVWRAHLPRGGGWPLQHGGRRQHHIRQRRGGANHHLHAAGRAVLGAAHAATPQLQQLKLSARVIREQHARGVHRCGRVAHAHCSGRPLRGGGDAGGRRGICGCTRGAAERAIWAAVAHCVEQRHGDAHGERFGQRERERGASSARQRQQQRHRELQLSGQ